MSASPRTQGFRPVGFGLIELMVAMVLGLLVVGAAFAIFQSNQRTFQANSGINRIQEGARVAFEMISNDVRAAGGSSCSNLARPDVEHSNTSNETAFLTQPVFGNASEFTVVSGDDDAYPVTSATTTSVTVDLTQAQEDNPSFALSDAFSSGQSIIVCNANQLYVVAVTGVSTNTISFAPATPVVMTNDPMAPGASVMVSRFRNVRWFVNSGSLMVNRNDGNGPQRVIDNVAVMRVSYLQRGGLNFVAAPTVWSDVVAVRVNMRLNGADSADGRTIRRDFSNIISLRSRVQ